MSELRTNRIIPRDGLVSGASGGIIQVVNSVFDSRYATSSHTTFTDTGLSATITPTRSDSKILAIISVGGVAARLGNYHQEPDLKLVRGSTDVATFTNIMKQGGYNFWIPKDGDTHRFTKTVMDSPATTSATTYKIQWTDSYGQTIYLNRGITDSDSIYYPVSLSHITVMEVAA